MTVAELRSRISHKEFERWKVYYTLEPWGTEPADRRAALISSTLANIHRGKNKPPFKLDHFMPRYGKKRRQTWREQLAIAKQWTEATWQQSQN